MKYDFYELKRFFAALNAGIPLAFVEFASTRGMTRAGLARTHNTQATF